MKAAIVSAFNKVPKYGDFMEPIPHEGEVRVKVLAAGLHPLVRGIANGSHYSAQNILPFIPGVDGVGLLEDGRRVYFTAARSPFGTMSEYSLAPEHWCIDLPKSLDDITAAALYNPCLSSWLSLMVRAAMVPGETVLINGATGVAGRLAIQIAKHLGAGLVIATGRSKESLEPLTALGADKLIELDHPLDVIQQKLLEAVGDRGVDIVLDYLWGEPAQVILKSLTETALAQRSAHIRFIQLGNSAGATMTFEGADLRRAPISLMGMGFGSIAIKDVIEGTYSFTEFAGKGSLITQTQALPLSEIEEVWQKNPLDGERLVLIPG